ncbi:MAG: glutamine-synthetase adenylyltransferase, partial [Pseudomonadota bacterium]
MALTKARVVLADGEMGEKLDTLVDNALVQPRDRHEVFQAVGEMRQRLLREKPPKSPLDVKRLRGGLIDIDFLVQGMSLIHGHELGRLPRNNVEALTILMNADKISRDDAEILCEAYVA